MIDAPSAPVAECEPEWLARPVSDLASHIATYYHRHTREELPLLILAGKRLVDALGDADASRVIGLCWRLSELREDVQAHAWAEGDLVFPMLAAYEQAPLTSRLGADSLDRFVRALADEHARIRGTLSRITAHLGAAHSVFDDPFGEWTDLRQRVIRLCDHVLDELALEERCLLPRLRLMASAARDRA